MLKGEIRGGSTTRANLVRDIIHFLIITLDLSRQRIFVKRGCATNWSRRNLRWRMKETGDNFGRRTVSRYFPCPRFRFHFSFLFFFAPARALYRISDFNLSSAKVSVDLFAIFRTTSDLFRYHSRFFFRVKKLPQFANYECRFEISDLENINIETLKIFIIIPPWIFFFYIKMNFDLFFFIVNTK